MKRIINAVLISLLVAFCASSLAACFLFDGLLGNGHVHDYRLVDNGDGTHVKHCSAEGCDQPDIDKSNHVYDENGVCECGGVKSEQVHRHNLTPVGEVDATCTREGTRLHFICTGCNEVFLTADGLTEALPEDLVIPAPGHEMNGSGVCANCGYVDWSYGGTDLAELSGGTYGYRYLGTMTNGEARQSLYTAIDEAVKKMHADTDTDCVSDTPFAQVNYSSLGLTADDAIAVWKTYTDDHPLYYWFSNRIGYSAVNLALYVDDDYSEGAVRANYNQLVFNKIKEYLSFAEAETSAYQVALAFHDRIINAIDYAYDDKGVPETAKWAHSVIGVLEERGGVCESYAKTFQLLLNLRGVENIFVTGSGNGEAHAWNLIKLDDGKWYWCDLTWDDAPQYTWGIYYGYFCVNDWQGVDWADGGNQYGTETGVGIGGSPVGCEKFTDSHIPFPSTGTGVNFSYALPARSTEVYKGVAGELRVRDTFEVGNYQYAVAGYGTVQVTKVPSAGAVVIEECVRHAGVDYSVISIGVVGGTGVFGAGKVIGVGVVSVTVPSSVKFIWSLSFYDCGLGAITFGGTTEQWQQVVKRDYWKKDGKTFTIKCSNGDITG